MATNGQEQGKERPPFFLSLSAAERRRNAAAADLKPAKLERLNAKLDWPVRHDD